MTKKTVLIAFLLMVSMLLFSSCQINDNAESHYKKAILYIEKQNNIPEAIRELKSAIEIDPEYTQARYQLGLLYYKTKKFQQAVKQFQQVATLDPEKIEATSNIAKILFLLKDYDQSKKYILQILQKRKNDTDALLLLTRLELKLNNPDAALTQLSKTKATIGSTDVFASALGGIYFVKKEYAKSEQAFRNAISINPDNFDHYIQLLNVLNKTNKISQSEELLLTMVQAFDQSHRPYLLLAHFYQKNNNDTKAENSLKKAMEIAPDIIQPVVALSRFYSTQKKPMLADVTLKSGIKRFPNSKGLQISYAELLFEQGHFTQSLDLLQKLLISAKRNKRVHLLNAKFSLKKGNIDQCIKICQELLKKSPRWDKAHALLAVSHFRKGNVSEALLYNKKALSSNPKNSNYLTFAARLHLLAGKNVKAKKYATAAIFLDKNNITAGIFLAEALIKNNEADKALDLLQKNEQLFSNSFSYLKLLSLAQKETQDVKSSVITYQKTLNKFIGTPKLLPHMFLLGKTIGSKNVLKSISETIQKNESNGYLLILYARLLDDSGQTKKAVTELKNAQELMPENPGPFIMRARFLGKLDEFSKAVKEYQTFIKMRPKALPGYMGLAEIYKQQGKGDDALSLYKKVHNLNPDYGPAANNAAWLISQNEKGDFIEALQFATAAKKSMPQSAEIADTLGFVHYKNESWALAKMQFQFARRTEPDNPLYMYHLGLAMHELGEDKQATAQLKMAIKNKSFGEKKEVRKILKKWGKD